MNNKLSEIAFIIVSHCWKNGKAVGITIYFKNPFEYKDKKYTLTERIVDEIRELGLVKVWGHNKLSICFTGIGEEPEIIKKGRKRL